MLGHLVRLDIRLHNLYELSPLMSGNSSFDSLERVGVLIQASHFYLFLGLLASLHNLVENLALSTPHVIDSDDSFISESRHCLGKRLPIDRILERVVFENVVNFSLEIVYVGLERIL